MYPMIEKAIKKAEDAYDKVAGQMKKAFAELPYDEALKEDEDELLISSLSMGLGRLNTGRKINPCSFITQRIGRGKMSGTYSPTFTGC